MSHVISVRLTDDEYSAFCGVQRKNRLTPQQLLHSIIIDALVDEGYDGLRCGEPEGCEGPGEAGQTRGPATS
jgi:hypothetical protein